MGAGKSTVGRALARRWSAPFQDLDELIGDIPALFREGGEEAFRQREREVLRGAVDGHGVLALGGGTVVSIENRLTLAGWPVVVLMARLETLRRRIGDGAGRPLAGALEELLTRRSEAYRTAGRVVWTDGLDADVVADRVEELC
jgi:shikimate kinase